MSGTKSAIFSAGHSSGATDSESTGLAFANGQFCALGESKVSVFDWGFLRNDVCYDTVTTWKGAFFRLEDHLERFERSAAGFRLECPYTRDEVRNICMELVRRSGLRDSYVQVILTRGRPPLGSRDPRLAENQFLAHAIPYVWIASPKVQERGVHLIISHIQRIPPESINPTYKNFAWMDMQQALLEAYDKGGESVVLVDRDGNITEGPGFNVFVVREGGVETPELGVLEGITRRTVLELCEELRLRLTVGSIPAADVGSADEVFISSSAGGIMPVSKVNGAPVGTGSPGPLTLSLKSLYWSKRESGWHATPVKYGT